MGLFEFPNVKWHVGCWLWILIQPVHNNIFVPSMLARQWNSQQVLHYVIHVMKSTVHVPDTGNVKTKMISWLFLKRNSIWNIRLRSRRSGWVLPRRTNRCNNLCRTRRCWDHRVCIDRTIRSWRNWKGVGRNSDIAQLQEVKPLLKWTCGQSSQLWKHVE